MWGWHEINIKFLNLGQPLMWVDFIIGREKSSKFEYFPKLSYVSNNLNVTDIICDNMYIVQWAKIREQVKFREVELWSGLSGMKKIFQKDVTEIFIAIFYTFLAHCTTWHQWYKTHIRIAGIQLLKCNLHHEILLSLCTYDFVGIRKSKLLANSCFSFYRLK